MPILFAIKAVYVRLVFSSTRADRPTPFVSVRPLPHGLGLGNLWDYLALYRPDSRQLSPSRRPLAHFFRKTYSINLMHFSVKNCLELLGKIFSPAVNQTVNPILAEFYDRHQVPWNNSAPFSFRWLWKLLNRVRAKIRTQATDSSRRKSVSTANARNLRHSYNTRLRHNPNSRYAEGFIE